MNLKHSILKTIAFFDLFDFPLTAEEIREHLYQYDKPVHIKEIKGVLGEMSVVENPEKKIKLEKVHDYYVLKGRARLVDTRKARKFIAEKFWNRTRQYCQYIVKIPFVQMVAVCNNLAYDNPTEQSDIDLFIVIKPGRMWLARLWITLVMQFFGVRRYGEKVAGRFCLSFFVTSQKLNMEPLLLKPKDPYLAYWTKLLHPIYGMRSYRKFIEENQSWLRREYGLNFPEINERRFPFEQKSMWKNFWEWVLGGRFGSLIEGLLKRTFKKRTLKKASQLDPEASVVVSDDMLKFHNQDRRLEYFDLWKRLVDS